MLRNVIVHIANEQPFMADLVNEPSPSDVSLICRNMRTMNGTKPVSVDFADSTFLLPIAQVRFIEIPAKAYEEAETTAGDEPASSRRPALRPAQARGKRSKTATPAPRPADKPTLQRAPKDKAGTSVEGEADEQSDTIVLLGSAYHDAELDNDLLRRIREA